MQNVATRQRTSISGWEHSFRVNHMRRATLKHVIRLFVPLLLGIFVTTTAFAAETKIGVIDWQQLLSKSPQAEEAGKRLEKEFQGRKDKLLSKQKEFQSKQEKLQRDRDVMSAQDRNKAEKELAKLQQDFRKLEEEFRSDYTARQREEMDDFVKVVREVVEKVAADEKYDVVLPQETTLYMADRIDVTDKVLQKMTQAKKSSDKDKK